MDEARGDSGRDGAGGDGRPAAGHVLLAGGGSAGHVYPGLAVGDALAARGWRVSWLGRRRGMERDLVTRRGVEYHGLPARALLGRGAVDKARALATTAVSALRARRLIRRHGVDAVLGTGGYACAPAVLGARLAGRPAFLLEPNARAGTANRWLARFSREVFLGFADTAGEIRAASRHLGVPVRAEFFAVPPPPPPPPRLLVLGGSQGAREINQLLPPLVAELAPVVGELEVLHQCGAAHGGDVAADYAGRDTGAVRVRVEPFLDDVAAAMAASHLVISRAGALTLAEICAAGRASVLLPLAIAGGHQRDNARRLVDAGAAVLAAGGAERAPEVAAWLGDLLTAPDRLTEMGAAARRLARPGAAAGIAGAIVDALAGARRAGGSG